MNYSLLIMESARMMKMATGEGFPLRQGAGTESRLVFGGYRGLRRRNSRSILFLDGFRVYGYIYIGERSRSGEPRGAHEGGGAPRGQAHFPASWPPRSFLNFNSKSPGSRSFQKSRSRRFHPVWSPFDIPFLRNTEIGNKTTIWAGPPVNRLVPKVI